MSEKRFSVQIEKSVEVVGKKPKSVCIFDKQENKVYMLTLFTRLDSKKSVKTYIDNLFEIVDVLNEQQEFIEELQVSDEMGWKRAERFEKKCPKELHNKKMYIKRLEYKVQKFKEENEQLKHYKLYEGNKRLQTIIVDLKEENEQLRKDKEQLKERLRECSMRLDRFNCR